MTDTVFIHTNHKQVVGALVAAYSLKRNSKSPGRFDVRILHHGDYPFLQKREGCKFLRGGDKRVWRNEDLQSFTPLRFMPPEAMGYQGRAVVIDPDVFAVGDVMELLSRDMAGKALMCVPRPGHNNRPDYLASSVMLLDCAQLTHWRCEHDFNEMFRFKRDYLEWIQLALEQSETIGFLEPEWNHFDRLDETTKLIHNTKRKTQPWKTGLPVDFTNRDKAWGPVSKGLIKRTRNRLTGKPPEGRYLPHPDPRQERFFFGLLRECVDKGIIPEELVLEQMARNHVRHDALEVLERTPPLAA